MDDRHWNIPGLALGQSRRVASAQVAIAGELLGDTRPAFLTLQLYAAHGAEQQLHPDVYTLSPELAAKIAAGWMARCPLLGPHAVKVFADEMAEGNRELKRIAAQLGEGTP